MTTTKWHKYGRCPRIACAAERGQPCTSGFRHLKHPHKGRHVVEYLPTERQTQEPHRCTICGTLRAPGAGDCPALSHGLMTPYEPQEHAHD